MGERWHEVGGVRRRRRDKTFTEENFEKIQEKILAKTALEAVAENF